MQPPRHPVVTVSWAVLLCAAVGCGDDFQQSVEAFATPTGALESGDGELVSQVQAIEQARGLASQLERPARADATNAAFVLAESYSPALHVRLTPFVETLLESDADPLKRTAFVGTNALLMQKTAAAADLATCQFDVGHRYGFFGRMSYLDDTKQASRLLQLRALTLATGQSEAADVLDDLLRSLRLAQWLSQVKRVEARVLAATLRAETLGHATTLIEAGKLRRYQGEQLYNALRDQLADWPSDSRMLVGERAAILHSYEAIRAGLLDRIVTLEERERLEKTGHLDRMRVASPETISRDQSDYLAFIGRLIASSDLPHQPRQEAIGEAITELSEKPSLFARSLFVEDLPNALRLLSGDRALAEAWTIALSAACRLQTPPFRESPLSGRPYEVASDARRVTVAYGPDSEQQVSLPMLATP